VPDLSAIGERNYSLRPAGQAAATHKSFLSYVELNIKDGNTCVKLQGHGSRETVPSTDTPPTRTRRLRVLNLVPILFQNDANQLAARPNSGFREELLQSGFHRAFRNCDAAGDLLVRQTLEHTGEDLPFPLGE
jgi:hypothetical protein